MSRTMHTPPPCPPAPAHPPRTGQNAQPLARPPQTISRTPFVRQPTPRARPCPPAHRPHRRYRPLHTIAPLLASSTTPLRRRFCAPPAQPMCTPHPIHPSARTMQRSPPTLSINPTPPLVQQQPRSTCVLPPHPCSTMSTVRAQPSHEPPSKRSPSMRSQHMSPRP